MSDHITIPDTTPRTTYTAAAAQTAFPVPWPFFDTDDVQVEVNGIAVATGYAVSGTAVDGGYSSGTVTFTAGRTLGDVVTLYRDITLERVTDFPYPSRSLQIEQLNTELDRIIALAQDLRRTQLQTVRTPPGDAALPVLPAAGDRANKLLVFDSSGAPYVADIPGAGTSLTGNASLATVTATGTTASRTLAERAAEWVSVTDFGVTMDGATNDTAAWAAAFASAGTAGHHLLVPAGTSLCDPLVFSAVSYIRVQGVGRRASAIQFSGSPGWTFSNCQDIQLVDLGFVGTTGDVGVRFDTGSGIGTVERCQFAGFVETGLEMVGTAIAPLSGHCVRDCLFLSNMGSQLRFYYSNDFWITGNQFGVVSLSDHPDYGCLLDNSSAGTYSGNYHWENVVGFRSINSHYLRVEMNRFEENQQRNVEMAAGNQCIFSGNTIHTASKASSGTYDSATFAAMTDFTCLGNQTFDWSGNQHATSYAYGAGCARVTHKDNRAANFAVAAVALDGSLTQADFALDAVLHGNSSTTIAAAATVYVGPGGQAPTAIEAVQVPGRRAVVTRLYLACDAAPGVGQTITGIVIKNGVATSMTAVLGAADFGTASVTNSFAVAADDTLTVAVTASAGATAARVRWTLAMAEY